MLVKDFILHHKYVGRNFHRRSCHTLVTENVTETETVTENVKTNNNIEGYHLVSRRVISTH